MRLSISKAAISLGFFLFLSGSLYASVDFVITPGDVLGVWDFLNISDTQNEIKQHPENLINNNEKEIPYGLALANTFGYPNGKAIIPNFEAGFAAGAAVYKYDRYENLSDDNPTIPGVGANAALHFGLGMSADTDLTFKLLINQGMYTPAKSINDDSDTRGYNFKLDETDIISLGIKGRYNLIGETKIIPFVLSFGGITAGVAVDYAHGKVSSKGTYTDRRTITFQGSDPFSGSTALFDQIINVETEVNGKAEFEWNIVSVTPEIMTYIDLLYFFTFYTGPAVSLNAGSANFNISASGDLKNIDPIYRDAAKSYVLINSDQTIASGRLTANAPLKVPVAVPLWKLGLEINIAAFKLQLEAATVLTSPTKSFTLQTGARVQF